MIDRKLRFAIWLHGELLRFEPRLGPILLQAVSRATRQQEARDERIARIAQQALSELRRVARDAALRN